MKKTLIVGALLVVAAAGSSLLLGSQTQKEYLKWVNSLSAHPGISAKSLDFESSLFAPTAKTKLSVTDPVLKASLAERGLPDSLVLVHQFQVWPWQVASSTAIAWDKKSAPFKALFGSDIALKVEGHHWIWGTQSLKGRVGMASWQQDGELLNFYPLTFSASHSQQHWQQSFNWNGMEAKSPEGRLVLSGVKLKKEGQGDDGHFDGQLGAVTYTGEHFVGLSGMTFKGTDSDKLTKGRLQAEEAKFNREPFSHLDLALAMESVNNHALDKLLLSALGIGLTGDAEARSQFSAALGALLSGGGKLQLDDLSLDSVNGKLIGRGQLALKAGTVDSLESFLAASQGELKLVVPRHFGELASLDTDTLNVLAQRGWVREESGGLGLDFKVADKLLTLNQQPLMKAL